MAGMYRRDPRTRLFALGGAAGPGRFEFAVALLPVGRPQAWASRGALEDGQLVPHREVLEHQGAARSEPAEEAGEDEGDHAGHHRSGRPTLQR